MNCIELFAGAGGAALGLERAGIAHAALCEWDPAACATMRAAGLDPVVEGDVRDLDAIEAVAGPSCDLLWSSFPCQPFSTAGRMRGAADDRNGWPWTVDAIDRFGPRWFIGENVSGILRHRKSGHPNPIECPRCYLDRVIVPDLLSRFKHAGFWLLDAADYGLPQHRRRVFIWAGPDPATPPPASHGQGMYTPAHASMFDALDIDTSGPPHVKNSQRWTGGPAPTLCARDFYGITLRKSAIAEIEQGIRPKWYPRQSVNDVLFMMTGVRRLTAEQCSILQGFPPGYPWQGSRRDQTRQAGNAVPPRLAEVVARAVVGDRHLTPGDRRS